MKVEQPVRESVLMTEDLKELVSVATFEFEYQAHLLRVELNENGIPAVVSGGSSVGAYGSGSIAASLANIHVYVHKVNADLARKLYIEWQANVKKVAPAWNCSCGVTVDEGFDMCWSCGREIEISASNE